MTSPIAHFNGELLPLDEIRVSPLDRGFIFGDGVYEVIPAYGGRLLRPREHFSRLQRSMDAIASTTRLRRSWHSMIGTSTTGFERIRYARSKDARASVKRPASKCPRPSS